MALVIEFAGIPCSGKSTVLKALFERPHSTSIIHGEAALEKFYAGKIRFFSTAEKMHFDKILKALVLLRVHVKKLFQYGDFYRLCFRVIATCDCRRKAFGSFYFKVGKYFMLKELNGADVLMDEGPIQVLFSLFVKEKELSGAEIRLLERIIERMPLPDKVIFGPVEPQGIFVDRLLKRGHHRVTGKRHSEPLPSGYVASEYEKKLARIFVSHSAMVQNLVQSQINGRIPIWRLESTSDWQSVLSSFSGSGRVVGFQ